MSLRLADHSSGGVLPTVARRCVWSRNIKNGCSMYIYIYIYIYDISSLRVNDLTLILLTRRKWWAPNNASKQQMGFNSAFKGLISSSSFLHLLPSLPITSIPPFIFPSITRYSRQFLRKMWPIQFAFCLRISFRLFLCSLTLSNTSLFLTWSVQLIFPILLQHHILKLSRCFWSTAQSFQVSF